MTKPSPLSLRREALVARCDDQRDDLLLVIEDLTAPLQGPKLKVPLAIAGVVLGMMAVRPKRALPLLGTALSLGKTVGPLLAALRRAREA